MKTINTTNSKPLKNNIGKPKAELDKILSLEFRFTFTSLSLIKLPSLVESAFYVCMLAKISVGVRYVSNHLPVLYHLLITFIPPIQH